MNESKSRSCYAQNFKLQKLAIQIITSSMHTSLARTHRSIRIINFLINKKLNIILYLKLYYYSKYSLF